METAFLQLATCLVIRIRMLVCCHENHIRFEWYESESVTIEEFLWAQKLNFFRLTSFVPAQPMPYPSIHGIQNNEQQSGFVSTLIPFSNFKLDNLKISIHPGF